MIQLFIAFLLVVSSATDCARILGVFQMPAVSHQRVFQPIWRELSLRGHEVIVVTTNPLRDPTLVNLTEIDVSGNYKIMDRHGFQFLMSKENFIYTKPLKIFEINYELAEAIFQNKEFIKIYNGTTQKFDLIIAQTYISPIMYSLSAKFNAPIVGVSSMGAWVGSHFAIGNPNPPSLYSEMFLTYNGHMTLYERICSTFYYLWARYFITFDAIPKCNKLARKYLGNDLPYLGDVERNLSLLFTSENPIFYPPRPSVPTVIPLGQMHLRPPKPLPADLQQLLDGAKEGVVYFSLGSNVKSVNRSDHLINTFIQTFAELPFTVLWKWEAEELPGKPENVITKKWLPQPDILAHPNIKVFVTQCGLQSTEEALTNGVPMVGIPFIADQPMNVKKLVEYGAAVGLDPVTLTKEDLKRAIMEIASNRDRYRKNVLKLKNLFEDQPMKPLDKAIWWIEYVIRHKGTTHLRSPMADVSWISYLLIDVILVVLSCFSLMVYIIIIVLKMCFGKYRHSIKPKQN